MLRKSIITIAMFSLLMTVAALAHPAQKRVPQQEGIWGHETNYGAVVKKPRPQNWSLGASNPTAVGSNQRKMQPRRPNMNQSNTIPTETLSLNFARKSKSQARVKR